MKTQTTLTWLLAALALGGLACQQAAPPAGTQTAPSPPGTQTAQNSQGPTAGQPPAAPVTHLKAGDRAPDFALTDTNGQTVRLSDFRGKENVVLAFYVLAFTGG